MTSSVSVTLPAATITSKDLRVGDADTFVKYWFSPDIGMVKQQVRTGKHETTLELEEFKPGR